MIIFSGTLPAGKKVVGDPCYAFSGSKVWSDVLAAHRSQGEKHVFDYCKRKLFFCDAGGATDDDGFRYLVDSATFGIVPLELVTADRDWLFREETVRYRKDKPAVTNRGAVLIESARPIEVKLIAEGRYRTLIVNDKRFELFEA